MPRYYRKAKRAHIETSIQIRVAQYLRQYYPDVLFHSDTASGIKLTAAQAATNKALQGGIRGYPDMIICKPSTRFDWHTTKFWHQDENINTATKHGLFIELKKDKTRLKKKDGSWASEHIEEQAQMLQKLRAEGYAAEFAVGYDEAVFLIDEYFNNKREEVF